MGGFEEFEPTELHKGNIATCKLEFQRTTMVRGPEQDCLLLQGGAAFAIFKHSSDDIESLISLVPNADELRSLSCDTLRPEVLREAFGCKMDNGIRRARIG